MLTNQRRVLPVAVVGVEAGAQLVEAAHNPDNLATSDRPRVRVTLVPDQSEDSVKRVLTNKRVSLVPDDWPREAIDHLPPAVWGEHPASVSLYHLRAAGLTSR